MFTSDTNSLKNYSEERILQFIREWLGNTSPPSPHGIGDDCAVFFAPEARASLISSDALIYGTHFDASISAFNAGRKITLRNLSDLAAMGGTPQIATVSILTSDCLSLEWLADFYRGIKDAADTYALKIVGGDLSALDGRQFQSVMTITGSAKTPILRQSASANEALYVTGQLGGSIAGKHFDFTPRLREGKWLSEGKYATSMIDVTDGISKELICLLAPKTSAIIDLNTIPLSKTIQIQYSNDPRQALEHAFCDGEDYELLFTLNPQMQPEVFEALWSQQFPNVLLTKIGSVHSSENETPEIIDQATQKKIEFGKGYAHF